MVKRSKQSLADERRRKRLRKRLKGEIDEVLGKALSDGLARLRGLSEEEWSEAVAKDEIDENA